MADRDFRIDLLMRAQFDQAKKALDDADRKLGSIGKTLEQGQLARSDGRHRAAWRWNRRRGGRHGGDRRAGPLHRSKTIEAEKVQAQLCLAHQRHGGVAGRTLEQLNEQAAKLQAVTIFDDEADRQRAGDAADVHADSRPVNFDRTIESATNLATVMDIGRHRRGKDPRQGAQ
jgi:hypothetical protein